MAVSGLLAQYLALKAQQTYYEAEQMKWNDLATSMSKKLGEQENLEDKWHDNSEKVDDVWGNESSSLIYKGVTYWNKGYSTMSQTMAATLYANAKVPKYDEDKLQQYCDLDMEYSTMVAMYDTLIEENGSILEGLKAQISKEAQDTHMLQ